MYCINQNKLYKLFDKVAAHSWFLHDVSYPCPFLIRVNFCWQLKHEGQNRQQDRESERISYQQISCTYYILGLLIDGLGPSIALWDGGRRHANCASSEGGEISLLLSSFYFFIFIIWEVCSKLIKRRKVVRNVYKIFFRRRTKTMNSGSSYWLSFFRCF